MKTMKPDANVVGTVILGAIAALVDGKASETEVNTLVERVTKRFHADETTVRTLAEKAIAQYTKKEVGKSPILALRYARKALLQLSPRNAQAAFAITSDVIASEETDQTELSFLTELKELTYPSSRQHSH
jgi:hypothetical protein